MAEGSKEALCWIDSYAKSYGDSLPNAESIHLPMCLTKEEVYDKMLDDLNHAISLSNFYSLVAKHRIKHQHSNGAFL